MLTTRSLHKDGRKLYLDLSFRLIKDAAGVVAGALAVGRDCTAREAARGGGQAAGRQAGDDPDVALDSFPSFSRCFARAVEPGDEGE